MADTSALESAKVFERLCNDTDFWWCTIALDLNSGAKAKCMLAAHGDTGFAKMKEYLYDDCILYGGVKVLAVDNKGAVTSTRQKIIFFQWVGPKVPKMKVAKALPLKAALGSYFQGHHVALELYDVANLSEENIEAKLRACGGAHAPDRYDFGTGSFVTEDRGHIAEPVSTPVAVTTTEAAPAPAPAAFPKAVTAAPSPAPAPAASTSSSSLFGNNTNGGKDADDDDDAKLFTKPKGRAADMFKDAFSSSSSSSSSSSGAAAKPTAASTNSSSSSSSLSAASAVAAVSSSRGASDALASVKALGRASSALHALLDAASKSGGGSVSVSDLQKFVAGELGEAAVKAAAALATSE